VELTVTGVDNFWHYGMRRARRAAGVLMGGKLKLHFMCSH